MVDAEGHRERYSYDDLGNRITLTNKKGAIWRYEYDAMGRLSRETTPQVSVSRVDRASLDVTKSQEVIITDIEYDNLGNVVRRTEAVGTPEVRSTQYVYDALGRQIQTIFPTESFYNAAADEASGYTGRNESQQTPIETTYLDQWSNAVAHRDVAGHFSYKVYDELNRLRYEIDAERHVTAYVYDSHSNQASLTRFAAGLAESIFTLRETNASTTNMATFSLSQLDSYAASLSSANDRTIEYHYDVLGRLEESRETAVSHYDNSAPSKYTAKLYSSKNHAQYLQCLWAINR
jgi:YD repeat-containing protein